MVTPGSDARMTTVANGLTLLRELWRACTLRYIRIGDRFGCAVEHAVNREGLVPCRRRWPRPPVEAVNTSNCADSFQPIRRRFCEGRGRRFLSWRIRSIPFIHRFVGWSSPKGSPLRGRRCDVGEREGLMQFDLFTASKRGARSCEPASSI